MPVARRKPTKAPVASVSDPRRKKKQTKTQEYTKIVLEEIRDFFLLVGGLGLVLLIGGIIQVYFYNGEQTLGFYRTNGPELTPCTDCQWETIAGLNVLTSGNKEGEMIVFLHGFPETAYLAWHAQINYFSNMGYFVVAPDQRGYNNSAKCESTSEYHVENLSNDVLSIMDHYGAATASVVGHDWGAIVAWHLGQFHSDRLEKLVVINVPHPQVMEHELWTSYTQLSKSWYVFFFQLPYIAEAKIRRNDYEWLSGAFVSSPRGTYSKSTLELYKEAWAQEGAVEGMLGWYRAAIRGKLTFNGVTPKRVENVPTLMLWGDQDRALGTSMAQPSIDMCDDGKLVVLEGISHWVQHEVPDKINTLIGDFLI